MLANRYVVADLDEVVDFCAALNPSSAEAGAVHGGVGTDFDIVVDLHGASLWDFLLFPIAEFIAKTVGSHHDSAMKNDLITDAATLTDCNIWVKMAVFAQCALLSDKRPGFNDGSGTNFGSRFDHHMGSDGTSLADLCIRRNDCGRMNAWLPNNGLRGEERKNLCKCRPWIRHKQAVGWNLLGKGLWKKNGRCASLPQRVDILGVSEKRYVSWIGVGQGGHIRNLDIPRFRSEPGVHTPGEVTESHYFLGAAALPASLFSVSMMSLLKSRFGAEKRTTGTWPMLMPDLSRTMS